MKRCTVVLSLPHTHSQTERPWTFLSPGSGQNNNLTTAHEEKQRRGIICFVPHSEDSGSSQACVKLFIQLLLRTCCTVITGFVLHLLNLHSAYERHAPLTCVLIIKTTTQMTSRLQEARHSGNNKSCKWIRREGGKWKKYLSIQFT